MNHPKRTLFTLAAVVVLGWLGTTPASAQCTASGVTNPNVRVEGTTELIGVIQVVCGAATTATAGSSIQVAVNGGTVAPGAGSSSATGLTTASQTQGPTTLNTCGTSAPNNTNTFPCPAITPTTGTAFVIAPTVTISGNTVTFGGITPNAGAQTLVIGGIRINASGFTAGASILATVSYSGGFNPAGGSAPNIMIAGTAVAAINRSSSSWPVGTATFPNNLNILSCVPRSLSENSRPGISSNANESR